jgi:ubiquinone/menaquinone biosynthesis C-methylase UbiE
MWSGPGAESASERRHSCPICCGNPGGPITASDAVFDESIPEIYDRYLVPLIFEHYAKDLAMRTAALSPGSVLEIAAGSGVVPRTVAPTLGSDARYTVTDLNQPMLDRARALQPPDERIRWAQADVVDLPFDDASFDLVLCQFAVMFFPDRLAAYREILRVLRLGGRFIFNTWDRIATSGFADAVTTGLATAIPEDPPMFLARTPHGYHDLALIETELTDAGFTSFRSAAKTITTTARDPSHPAIAYCKGTPLRNEIVDRDPEGLDRLTDVATQAIVDQYGSGPVAAPAKAFIIDAVK